MNVWLVVPCQGSQRDILVRFLKSVEHPPERTVIVTTSLDELRHDRELFAYRVWLPWRGYHISKWWNAGLDLIEYAEYDEHVIVVASSRIVGTPDSLHKLAHELTIRNWTMAGPNYMDDTTRELPSLRTAHARVPGTCWAIHGGKGTRADERYRWRHSDDDLETSLRRRGPVGLVGGTGLYQGEPDTTMTDEQTRHSIEDRASYVRKWGREPW